MDVNGAKALKERLGLNGTGEPAPPADVDIPEDAPPVYHWVGVPRAAGSAPDTLEDDPAANVSLFRRLGLSFR